MPPTTLPQPQAGVYRRLVEWQGELTAFRRDLHAHPELGFEERRTAARVVERQANSFSSVIGNASMSARRPMDRRDDDARPRISATTPVLPMFSCTSSAPATRSASATRAAVRRSSKPSSG